jgi:hypothetical protein
MWPTDRNAEAAALWPGTKRTETAAVLVGNGGNPRFHGEVAVETEVAVRGVSQHQTRPSAPVVPPVSSPPKRCPWDGDGDDRIASGAENMNAIKVERKVLDARPNRRPLLPDKIILPLHRIDKTAISDNIVGEKRPRRGDVAGVD